MARSKTQGRSRPRRKTYKTKNVPSRKVWERYQNYKSFLLNETRFRVGDTISVANRDTVRWQQDTGDGKADADCQPKWAARITSIRAKDPANVYALVQWFYYPRDLPEKAQTDAVFGEQELILSNHIDLIRAQSVIDILEVKDLRDVDDAPRHGMYWRRFWDVHARDFCNNANIIGL